MQRSESKRYKDTIFSIKGVDGKHCKYNFEYEGTLNPLFNGLTLS